MAREATAEVVDAPVKRRRASGPRRPAPLYIFVKIDEGSGKPTLAAAFKDPRKMATYFNTSKEEGSELLVITPDVDQS